MGVFWKTSDFHVRLEVKFFLNSRFQKKKRGFALEKMNVSKAECVSRLGSWTIGLICLIKLINRIVNDFLTAK